jgi:pimeloyl-ACP methyl ester carboxylesterase
MLHHTIYKNENLSASWIVFIHGAGGSSTIWFKQVNAFRKKYHVLLVDLRGHGRTLVDEEINKKLEYTFPSISQEVIDLLDEINIDKAHFVGVSLGTLMIRQIAELQPNRIVSMIMSGAIIRLTPFSRFLIFIGNTCKKIVPFIFLYSFFAWIILPRRNHKKSRAIFIHEAKKMKKTEFIRWFGLTGSLDATLKRFEKSLHDLPVLFISGRQDHMFIEDVIKMAHTENKGALAVIENCGHIVNIEKFEDFNQVTLEWLGKFNS